VFNHLACLHMDVGDYAQAEPLLREVLDMNPAVELG